MPSSSSPPSLLPSSSLPPLSLSPSSSLNRSRSPSPPLPLSVSPTPTPLPSPPSAVVPPPPEHIKSVWDNFDTLRTSLASAMQETMTLRARVGLLKKHDVVTRESLRIARGKITQLHLQEEYVKQEDIEASHVRTEAAEQRAETLHVSLGAARMDVRDLIDSCEAH
ncbi:hypothetical protein Tco_1429573 [Tanacetum coccineum]